MSGTKAIGAGVFISLEGIDGAGKSTHFQALAEALRANGHDVALTREPGGTPLAEKIRAMALHEPMDALTEALLMFAARRDHVARVIQPALARGSTVLCDRFADATFAYQGGGRGLSWETLHMLERLVLAASPTSEELALSERSEGAAPITPDLTLWFDLPATVAADRLGSARVPDKFEAEPLGFFEAVRAAYARRAQEAPARFARIDADQPPAAVWKDVQAAVRARGWL